MTAQPSTQSTSLEPNEVLGHQEPRIWTPPIRELTPETSYGYDVIEFAETVLNVELDPWQRWLAIHAGELYPDGRPRFRTVLALVARQNGKTLLAKVFIMYWMVIEQQKLILATGTNRSYAKITWDQVREELDENPYVDATCRLSIGEEAIFVGDSTYKFAANGGKAGRSLTVHRLLIDEIREHKSWDTWGAATNAMQAVAGGQTLAISNQGDDEAIVLNSLRASAIERIEDPDKGDERIGLFEWSAVDGAQPDDPEAIAAANPNLGDRITLDTIMGAAKRAIRAGGEELATFRTEVLCQKVAMFDAAIDEASWNLCGTDTPEDLKKHRRNLTLCFDVSLRGDHATLMAAVEVDGIVRLEVVKAWDDYGCISRAKRELPSLVTKISPRRFGWYPKGPAAGIATTLTSGWEPRGCELVEIHAELPAVCMGLAEAVIDRIVEHNQDPMLHRHITLAQRKATGDAWTFTRKGSAPIDGAYSAAGALHLVRTLPAPKPALVAL